MLYHGSECGIGQWRSYNIRNGAEVTGGGKGDVLFACDQRWADRQANPASFVKRDNVWSCEKVRSDGKELRLLVKIKKRHLHTTPFDTKGSDTLVCLGFVFLLTADEVAFLDTGS